MTKENIWNDDLLKKTIKSSGIAVIPTDTVYGIVGRADNKNTVERIYETRRRNPERPCIILVGDVSQIKDFSVALSNLQEEKIKEFWPGPVSIIFDCFDEKFKYLHRGTNTLAFRLPQDLELREFLKESGPIIAPSANPEGYPTAKSIDEAKGYFGDAVDCYVDGGVRDGKPSKVIKIKDDGGVLIIRE